MTPQSFDVVIVGAGTAGSAAASLLAQRNLKVALVERRGLANAGARWTDDVPPWMFDRAGVARPHGSEKLCDHLPIVIEGTHGRGRKKLLRPMWGVDVPSLVARLQRAAADAGATLFDRTTVRDVVCIQGRLTQVLCSVRDEPLRLRAALFVDASGIAGVLRRRVPAMLRACPDVRGADLCTASQYVCEVADRHGAEAFLERHRLSAGDVFVRSGIHGGFSSRMVQVEPGLDRVSLLTGVSADQPGTSGPTMMRALRDENRWIGAIVSGGAGKIPIRRPYDRIAAPGLALLGDAACQTFPAHGSGVGSGILAARILADSVAALRDPGSMTATWAYQRAFHRDRGAVHAAYDVLRRMSQSLGGAAVERMMDAGLITETSIGAALDQRMPRTTVAEANALVRAFARVPRSASSVIPHVSRMQLVHRVYRHYPGDPRWLASWARTASIVAGQARDPD